MRSSVTRIETKISGWEEKETLTAKDHQSILRTLKWLQELNEEFNGYHYSIVELMDHTGVLAEEQKVLDALENKVEDLMESLEDLVTTEPVMRHVPGIGDDRPGVRLVTEVEHLSRRLDQVHDSLMKVKRVKEDKAIDVCSLKGHEERVKSIDTDLQVIKRDMLLIGDYKSLADRAATCSLEEASFEIRVAIKRRLKNINAKSTASKETGLSEVKLPKVSVPTFDGNVPNWKNFWKQFNATIQSKTSLSDTAKDGPARLIIHGLTRTSESYEEAIKCLKEQYDWPKLIQEDHIRSIVDAVTVKNRSDKEFRRLYDAATQHYRALKAAKRTRSTQFLL